MQLIHGGSILWRRWRWRLLLQPIHSCNTARCCKQVNIVLWAWVENQYRTWFFSTIKKCDSKWQSFTNLATYYISWEVDWKRTHRLDILCSIIISEGFRISAPLQYHFCPCSAPVHHIHGSIIIWSSHALLFFVVAKWRKCGSTLHLFGRTKERMPNGTARSHGAPFYCTTYLGVDLTSSQVWQWTKITLTAQWQKLNDQTLPWLFMVFSESYLLPLNAQTGTRRLWSEGSGPGHLLLALKTCAPPTQLKDTQRPLEIR